MRFDGKVAVVTSGSSGLGLAVPQRFVAEGGYVFITSRRQSELDKAVAPIGHSRPAVMASLNQAAAHRFAAARNNSAFPPLAPLRAASKGARRIVCSHPVLVALVASRKCDQADRRHTRFAGNGVISEGASGRER